MAWIGLQYPVAAKYGVATNGTSVEYTEGRVLGKAISLNATIESTDAKLHADDDVAEQIKEFNSGTISINLDDDNEETTAWLLGHTKNEEDEVVSEYTDAAPYVGIGCYGRRIKSGVSSYRAIWFTKAMFSEPNTELSTKGESIEFGTPTYEGTLMRGVDKSWRITKTFATETEARAWLNEKAGINNEQHS